MTPDELPAFLSAIRDRAATAAPPVADAMGEAYRARVTRVTLRTYSHAYGAKTDSPPGQPPAWVLGALARSVTNVLTADGGVTATATVGPHTIYARIQELGGVIHARHRKFLRYVEDGEVHYAKSVTLPPRPYMAPSTEACIEDGTFTRTAMESFAEYMWGT